MARASDGVEFRLGGVIDRGAVLARIAAREVPLAAPPPPPPPPPVAPEPPAPQGDLVPFSTIRTRTAAHLRHSLDTAAHALLVVEIDWSAVDRVRRAAGLTYLPFVARAVVEAARQFPHVNATTTDEGLRVSRAVHLGVAVDLAFEGLVVPVVHDAGDLRLRTLASRIDDAATRARSGKLTMADLEGGTFTVTNVGSYGTVSAAPIINHPQVAILSTDGIRMRPVAVPGDDGDWRIAIHPVGNLSLAFDHRAIDGAYAAAFLARVRHELEQRDWEAER
jgi:pyruvate dehydrogenase E2 component (dihydrolipoamide acetyltransferase)